MKIVLSLACAFLLFLLQKYIYKRIWERNLGVTVSFVTPFAVEGQEGSLTEVIENKKWFPVPVLRVRFSFARGLRLSKSENVTQSDKHYKNDIFTVMPYIRITRTHTFLCEKRGFYTIDSLSLASSDLLMSANFVAVRPNNTSFIVYPRRADVKRLLPVFSKIMGNRETKAQIEDPFTFRGIRDYAPFDSVRAVNWKASAKTGDLKVNLRVSTLAGEVQLILNLEPDSDWVDNGIREEAIRIAATLASMFMSKGVTVSLRCNGCDMISNIPSDIPGGCGAGHEKTIKEALARIDLTKRCVPFSSLAQQLLQDGNKKMQTILITGAKGRAQNTIYEQMAAKLDMHVLMLARPDTEPLPQIQGASVTRWEVRY